MQETQVGWAIHRAMPSYLAVYILYAFFVLCIAVVRSIRTARQLWWYKNCQKTPLRKLCHEFESSSEHIESNDRLQREFEFQWNSLLCGVHSLRRNCVLISCLAAFATMVGVADIASRAEGLRTATPFIAQEISYLAGGIATGLLLCAITYAAAMFVEGALVRRKILWDYKFAENRLSSTKN
jgi:hypothetical protein